MKKFVPLFVLTLLASTTPVLAAKDSSHGSVHKDGVDTQATVSVQVSAAPSCDPNAAWASHGAYVSCVAKEHLGGAVTSVAAESSIGKHEDEGSESGDEPSPTPSISPSPTESASPSVSPSESPSPTSSESATPSASASISTATNIELQALVSVLKNILESLQHLI